MRFAFIQTHARTWHITTMCRVLEVSKAGYYAWRARPLCKRVQTDRELTEQICAIQKDVKQRYGSPRVRQELLRVHEVRCGKNHVARLMREAGVLATITPQFRVTTQSDHEESVAPNVVDRQFSLEANPRLNTTWAADITYVRTQEGWLYLAVVLDLASRRNVGWAMRTRLGQELTLAALQMALTQRGARGGVHHSDRGAQYASHAYQQLLREAGFTPSMSGKGDCWDNAVVESFFATLTKELLGTRVFETRAQAQREIFEFIEIWYNRKRRHSTLNYYTPVEFEEQVLKVS